MKPTTTKFLIRALTSVAGLAWLTSCASTGVQHADKTGASMAAFRNDIVAVSKSVDATVAALTKVLQTADTDPRPAFNTFSSSLGQLDRTVATAKARGREIEANGNAYFKQWEADLQTVENPEIRKLADKQKAKLQDIFARIKPLTLQVRADFDPFSADCRDLQKYLRNDLTVIGVDAAKALILKTVVDGRNVQKSLENLIAELNTIAATLTPASIK